MEIMPVTIIAVRLAANTFKPLVVGLIPIDGLRQPFSEIPGLLPAQGVLQLAAIQRVAAVMSGPVRNEANERSGLFKSVQDAVRDLDIPQLAFAADVVHLGVLASVQDQIESAAMILDVNPIPGILPIAVNRQRLR